MHALTRHTSAREVGATVWREHGLALGVAVALHVGLGAVLLKLAAGPVMVPAVAAVLTTQLVSLPAPVPVAVAAAPAPAEALPPPPPAVIPPESASIPEPVSALPPLEQAELAHKRLAQERRDEARRIERQRHALREEKQRLEQRQRLEQAANEKRLREQRLQEQLQAQASQAEAERQATAVRAAAARAQAEAASREYLPIAKDAPDYPAKALDRKIEGECTVAYTVNVRGQVEAPQVVGPCHPLFVKPSLAAARSFRYQPKITNGQAVPVANVKNTFSYRIR